MGASYEDLKSVSPEMMEALRYWLPFETRKGYVKLQCDVLYERIKDRPGDAGDITVGKIMVELGPAAALFEESERSIQDYINSWYEERGYPRQGKRHQRGRTG